MKSQCGKISVNMILVIMIVIIGILMGVLIFNKKDANVSQADSVTTSTTPDYQNPDVISTTDGFDDGLGRADNIKTPAPNADSDVDNIAVFMRDINNDGITDRITRTHHATGNAHDWDEYKIEIKKDNYFDNITPDGFRTTMGADCALRKIKFSFRPQFSVVIVSRPFHDTWNTPSVAEKTTYSIKDDKLIHGTPQPLSAVCDVAELF